MDLNQIATAKFLPANQIRFDQEAVDQAVLRGEKRRANLRKIWSWLRVSMAHSWRISVIDAQDSHRPVARIR